MRLISTCKDIFTKLQNKQKLTSTDIPPSVNVPLANIDFALPNSYKNKFATLYVFTLKNNEHCYIIYNKHNGIQLNNVLHLSNGKKAVISQEPTYIQ